MSSETGLAERKPIKMELTPAELKVEVQRLNDCYNNLMQEGTDYGTIPGTPKPSLWKPGAEILMRAYHLEPETEIMTSKLVDDPEHPYFDYDIRIILYRTYPGGERVRIGDGIGNANTRETRYALRWMPEWDLPPDFDKKGVVTKKNKSKRTGKIFTMYRRNSTPDEIYTLKNTVFKMAKKRAMVDAVLTVTSADRIFTQDVEDLPEDMLDKEPPEETIAPAKPIPAPTKPQLSSPPTKPPVQTPTPKKPETASTLAPAPKEELFKIAEKNQMLNDAKEFFDVKTEMTDDNFARETFSDEVINQLIKEDRIYSPVEGMLLSSINKPVQDSEAKPLDPITVYRILKDITAVSVRDNNNKMIMLGPFKKEDTTNMIPANIIPLWLKNNLIKEYTEKANMPEAPKKLDAETDFYIELKEITPGVGESVYGSITMKKNGEGEIVPENPVLYNQGCITAERAIMGILTKISEKHPEFSFDPKVDETTGMLKCILIFGATKEIITNNIASSAAWSFKTALSK